MNAPFKLWYYKQIKEKWKQQSNGKKQKVHETQYSKAFSKIP